MKKYILVFMLLFVSKSFSQIKDSKEVKKDINIKNKKNKKNINPKGNLFFGIEIGGNSINSVMNDSKIKLQGGFLVEYYIFKQLSVSVKLKKFETGLSFYQPEFIGGGMGFFSSYSHGEYSGTFNGEVFSITPNVKWEFRIIKNFKGNIKYGFSFNKETKSEYLNYSETVKTDYPTFYIKQFGGLGFNYFIDSTSAIYLDLDFHNGETKGYIYVHNPQKLGNTLVSIGYKYSFN